MDLICVKNVPAIDPAMAQDGMRRNSRKLFAVNASDRKVRIF
ncbi:MAG: hypothetical protein ACK4NS_10435 [Saprospiraceae bacterium]